MSEQLPHLPGHWLTGNLSEFNNDTLAYIEKLAKLGDTTFIKFGPFPGYLFNHPDDVRDILVTKNASMHKPNVTKQAVKDISGENLFSSDGDYWKTQRKLIAPAFHTQRIREYADIMVDYALAMVNRWQADSVYDMYHVLAVRLHPYELLESQDHLLRYVCFPAQPIV